MNIKVRFCIVLYDRISIGSISIAVAIANFRTTASFRKKKKTHSVIQWAICSLERPRHFVFVLLQFPISYFAWLNSKSQASIQFEFGFYSFKQLGTFTFISHVEYNL